MCDDGDDDPWLGRATDTNMDEADQLDPSTNNTDETPARASDKWEWVQLDNPNSQGQDQGDDRERLWQEFNDATPETEAGNKDSHNPDATTDDVPTVAATDRSDSADIEINRTIFTEDRKNTESQGNRSSNESSIRTDVFVSPVAADKAKSSESGHVKSADSNQSEQAGQSQSDSLQTPPGPPGLDGASSDAGPAPSPPAGSGKTADTDVPPPPPPPDGQDGVVASPPGPTQEDIQDLQPLYTQRTKEFYFLWFAASLTYGLGDMLTTSMVLVTPRVGEANPFVAVLLKQFGFGGFVGAKLVIFGLLIVISVKSGIKHERFAYYAPPVFAILVGTGLTLWNLKAIFGL
jgi:hypothetical protein